MTPEQRRKFHSKWGPAPISITQLEEICRLVPERKEAVLALADAGLTGEQAEELLEELRKPRAMPVVASGDAERLHAQSGEVLAQRQAEELREMRERDSRIEHRSVGGRLRRDVVLSPEELGRWRYEQMLGFWVEQQRFAEEQQRQLQDNDPYNSRGGYR
jgi:hypothetical protein